MKNTKIWSVSIGAGTKYTTRDGLTKKEAKELLEKLAKDTTKNVLNDYLDLLILRRADKELATVERVGKGEYSYRIGRAHTLLGYQAAELIKRI